MLFKAQSITLVFVVSVKGSKVQDPLSLLVRVIRSCVHQMTEHAM